MRTLQHKTRFFVIYNGKEEFARYMDRESAESMYYGLLNSVRNGWTEGKGEITIKEEYR